MRRCTTPVVDSRRIGEEVREEVGRSAAMEVHDNVVVHKTVSA